MEHAGHLLVLLDAMRLHTIMVKPHEASDGHADGLAAKAEMHRGKTIVVELHRRKSKKNTTPSLLQALGYLLQLSLQICLESVGIDFRFLAVTTERREQNWSTRSSARVQ